MNYAVQVITAFLGSLGFSIIFNIQGTKLFFAAFGGLLSWSIYLLSGLWFNNPVAQTFLASMLITVYAEVGARYMRTPTTTFLTAAIIPLVPGSSLYYTMSYATNRMFNQFLVTGVETLSLAVAIAAGIVVTSSIYKIIMVIYQKL